MKLCLTYSLDMCPVVDYAHLSLCIIVTMEEDLKLASS